MVRLRDLALTVCALAAWLSLFGWAAGSRAEEPRVQADRTEPLRALVRLAEPADHALLSRIHGQASDLSLTLSAVERAPLERSLREQLATARVLARESGARVVVWAKRSPSQLTLVIDDLTLDRVLVRELPSGSSERDRSAQEEAAALVVRSALKASIAGAPLGQAERELAPEPVAPPVAVAAASSRSTHSPAAGDTSEIDRRTSRARTGLLALGLLGAADGATRHGNYGLVVRAALGLGRLELGLRGSFGFRAPVESPYGHVQLAQHRLTAYAGFTAFSRGPLRLTLAASAGALLYATHVRTQTGVLQGQGERGALALLAVGAWLGYTPRFTRGRVGLAVSAFVEAFPQRLTLGYQASQGFVRFTRAWPVQPVLTLELVVPLS